MNRPMDRNRWRQLVVVGGAALLVTLAAIIQIAVQGQQSSRPENDGPVLAAWAEQSVNAARITIETADESFVIERRDDGWVMPSRDDHPVRAERIAALDLMLAGLSYGGARTRDLAKHDRLGLGAPQTGGNGMRVTIAAQDGGDLADLIIGRQAGARVYIRRANEDQTFAVRLGEGVTALPAIRSADDWLELDFLALDRAAIAWAEIQPETGPAYRLERAARASRNFALRRPSGWRPITAGAGNGPAAALGRLRFRDVRRADRLSGEVVARHTAETFAGLRVSLNVVAQGETRWAIIQASAVTDDAQADATRLSARVDGWAYLLSDLSLDRLLRPLDQIADPREDTEDAP